MSAGTIDALAIAKRLKATGFSEDQAEAVTGVLREVRDADLATLVTKADLSTEIGLATRDLRREIADVKFEILKWVLPASGFQMLVVIGTIVALARSLH